MLDGMGPTTAARLLDRTNKNGPVIRAELGPCWVFTGFIRKNGYGEISNWPHGMILAHRAAWLLTNGAIPAETPCVLHKCDNRPCVRPDHLFLGTYADNNHDCFAKGRSRANFLVTPPRGEAHPSATRTEAEVRAIREAYAADDGPSIGRLARIARAFGIKRVTAGAIIHRRIWKHVA